MRALLGCGLLILLAACQVREDSERDAAEASGQAAGDDVIECALDGAAEFKRACVVERAEVDGVRSLTVRHPDGGFRRFDVLTDGRGLAAADGADEASLSVDGPVLAVTVADDRYRFPMTLKSDDPVG